MKRVFFILSFLFVLSANSGFATPPTSIALDYDLNGGILHVEAVHPSFNLDKSYVRLMNVYLNGVQIFTQDYFKQDYYDKFLEVVPMAAKPGDDIKVELFCSLGGEMSQELSVPTTQANVTGVNVTDNSMVNSTTDNIVN